MYGLWMDYAWWHASKICNINALPVPTLRQVSIFAILVYVFALIFKCFFWRSLFHIFCDFGVPRASKIGAFGVHFDDFFVIG